MHRLLSTCIFIKGLKFLKMSSKKCDLNLAVTAKFRKALKWEDSTNEMTSCMCHTCNASKTPTSDMTIKSFVLFVTVNKAPEL